MRVDLAAGVTWNAPRADVWRPVAARGAWGVAATAYVYIPSQIFVPNFSRGIGPTQTEP